MTKRHFRIDVEMDLPEGINLSTEEFAEKIKRALNNVRNHEWGRDHMLGAKPGSFLRTKVRLGGLGPDAFDDLQDWERAYLANPELQSVVENARAHPEKRVTRMGVTRTGEPINWEDRFRNSPVDRLAMAIAGKSPEEWGAMEVLDRVDACHRIRQGLMVCGLELVKREGS